MAAPAKYVVSGRVSKVCYLEAMALQWNETVPFSIERFVGFQCELCSGKSTAGIVNDKKVNNAIERLARSAQYV